MLCPFTNRKKAWLALSCKRLLIILMSSLMFTWSGTRNLVLSRTGSCFSPLYRSMITGILVGCCSRISRTSSTLCPKVRRCLKVSSDGRRGSLRRDGEADGPCSFRRRRMRQWRQRLLLCLLSPQPHQVTSAPPLEAGRGADSAAAMSCVAWSYFLIWKKWLIWFQFSWICWGLFCIFSYGLSLKMFNIHLKIMCVVLFGDETIYLYKYMN